MKRRLSTLAIIFILTIATPVTALAGTLINDGKGFRYQNDDGSFAKNCRRCVNYFALHFDANGYADKTGWDACKGSFKNTKKGKRYFFEDGKIPKGEWLLSDGVYYTFDDNGYVVSERKSPMAEATTKNTTTKNTTTQSKTNKSTTNNSSKNTENKTTTDKTTEKTSSDEKSQETPSEENKENKENKEDKNTTTPPDNNQGSGETPSGELVSAEILKGRTKMDGSINFSNYVCTNGFIVFRPIDVVYTGGDNYYHISFDCAGGNKSQGITFEDATQKNGLSPCKTCTTPYLTP